MNASTTTSTMSLSQQLKDNNMSLDDKLEAIEAAMAAAQQQANGSGSGIGMAAPLDPQDLLMCESCQ